MKPNKANKRTMIYCEPCAFKKIFEPDESINLVEIKRSSVQLKGPKLNPASGTTNPAGSMTKTKMVKCPKCGRGVVVKELQSAYTKVYEEIDRREQKAREEADRIKRLEDGKPHERQNKDLDPDFLG